MPQKMIVVQKALLADLQKINSQFELAQQEQAQRLASGSQSYNMIVPLRFNSRKPLMETQNHIPPNTTANQEEEIYRIVAKIRSLEDDVRTVQNQNREIEAETKYLVRMLHDLEEAVDTQDQEIQQLTHHIQKESGQKMDFTHYESILRSVGQKVELLHEMIAEKNKHHEMLRSEKQHAMLEHLKLKEECNVFQYEYNSLLESIDQLLGLISHQDFAYSQLQEEKIAYTIQYCNSLERQTAEIAEALQSCRKDGTEAVMLEKEKRIKCEFNIEQLRQKWKDYQQKKVYFANCYNEQNIQAVIDDMVHKETLLREQILAQQEKCQALRQQTTQALACFEKRKSREGQDLQEEVKAHHMQIEIAKAKKQKILSELRKIQQSIKQMEEEGLIVTQQIRQSQGQIYERIGQIESENMQLEKELAELKGKVDLLQLELSSN